MQNTPRLAALMFVGLLGAGSMLAQQAPPAPPAQGGPPPGQGRGGGGGRGGAVSFTPAQAIALATMNVPQAAIQAAADARAELVRASLTVPANQADLKAKADALAKAEQALAVQRAGELARVGGASLNLTPEQ